MLLYHQHVLHVIVSLLRLFLDLFYCVSLLVTLSMTMSSHQKELVNELRENVQEILKPHHDDVYLSRWLIARNWNVGKAELMLRESFKWREVWDIDNILKHPEPEVLTLYSPFRTTGAFDKEGSIVIQVVLEDHDVAGIINTATRNQMIKFATAIIEKNLALAKENSYPQIVLIADFKGNNPANIFNKRAVEYAFEYLKMYQQNYPDCLKVCYIINTSVAFKIIANMMKACLHENTMKKVHVFDTNRNSWEPEIKKLISPENLSVRFGGTLEVKEPVKGIIPESFYITPGTGKLNFSSYNRANVAQRSKLTLDFYPKEPSFLCWSFFTEKRDIMFGISYENEMGRRDYAVHPERLSCSQYHESGTIKCQDSAIYTVSFDNTYSYFHPKVLYYKVWLATPNEVYEKNDWC